MEKLLKIIKNTTTLNANTFAVIVLLSICSNLLYLGIPIAAQILVNFVAFAQLYQPLLILTFFVLFIMLVITFLVTYRIVIIETILQKIFIRTAVNFSRKLPKLQLSIFNRHSGPELVNRFFEVVSIQKAIDSILFSGVDIVIQSLFGMILLAIYHPLLLVFDILLVLALLITVLASWRKAVYYSVQECSEKHKLAAWLEQLVFNPLLFKLGNNQLYGLEKTDKYLVNYLLARQKHFSKWLGQVRSIYIIAAIASATLLGLGGILVMKERLSLGQLVASEIILAGLINNFVKLGHLLDDFYDLIASHGKINEVSTLETESSLKENDPHLHSLSIKLTQPPSIVIDIQQNGDLKKTIEIPAGGYICLLNKNPQQDFNLMNNLLGFTEQPSIRIRFNHLPMHQENLREVRKHIAVIGDMEIFPGSILENLLLHRQHITIDNIYDLLRYFGILEKIIRLPLGINTLITDHTDILDISTLQKLLFTRALLSHPKLIIVDHIFDSMRVEIAKEIINFLENYPQKFTLIVLTSNENISQNFKLQATL